MKLVLIALFVFAVNIPLGVWRRKVRKFSFKWLTAIHISIPFIVLVRYYSNLGFGIETYLILIPVFTAGQNYFPIKNLVLNTYLKIKNSDKE